MMVVRHLVAVIVLPFTVAVLVPWRLAARFHIAPAIGSSPLDKAIQLAGCAALALGLWLFEESLRYFVTKGRGTLAPWDPPRRLVVEGPYRYVRNPMISGVIFIVFGEALVLRSWPHAEWALAFVVVNLIYIPFLEEPMLEARFGDSYRDYCRRVRRVIPGPERRRRASLPDR